MPERIVDGRTDLVFEYLAEGHPANSADDDGVSLIKWCAYSVDVSAIRFLLANDEPLQSLGDNLGLNGAAFHGHWRLCQFLIESGADVNRPLPDTGETPLHRAAAFGTEEAIQLLLDAGAKRDAKDMNGDSPLSWASWHLRPDSILSKLWYGGLTIHPDRQSIFDHGMGWGVLEASILGTPHV